MVHEIELKLRLAPADVAAAKRLLSKLAGRRGHARDLLSIYFDTPDWALRDAGLALRVRKIGKRRVQTLKQAVSGPHGAQSFRELENNLSGDRPRPDLLDDPALRRKLLAPRIAGALAPAFRTRFARTAWPIARNGALIEATLDIGQILAGRRRMKLCEIELELKSGTAQGLFDLAMAVAEALPLSIEHRTKSDRGFGLASEQVVQPTRAAPVPLSSSTSAGAAFAAITHGCIEQIARNEIVVRHSDDPEGVHQMRVGLRRLRAVIGAYRKHFQPAKLAELTDELDWLQQELAVRDWDVFIEETLGPLSSRMPEDPALTAVLDTSKAIRAEGYAAMRKMLDGRRYAAMQLKLYSWLADDDQSYASARRDSAGRRSAGALAWAVLSKRYKRLMQLGGKNADLPEADLHRLRLQAKKLRYVAEFFRGLYPGKSSKRFIGAIAAVQDHLGPLNDALVSQRLLSEIGRRLRDADQGDLANRGIALVEGWQAARIDRDLRELRQVWKAFRQQEPFWSGPGRKS